MKIQSHMDSRFAKQWAKQVALVVIFLLTACTSGVTPQPIAPQPTATTFDTFTPNPTATAVPTHTPTPTMMLTSTVTPTITVTNTLEPAKAALRLGIRTDSEGNADFSGGIDSLPTRDGRHLRAAIADFEEQLIPWIQLKRTANTSQPTSSNCNTYWNLREVKEGLRRLHITFSRGFTECTPDELPGKFEAAFRAENIKGKDAVVAFYRINLTDAQQIAQNGGLDFFLVKSVFTRVYFEHGGSVTTLEGELRHKHHMFTYLLSLDVEVVDHTLENARFLESMGTQPGDDAPIYQPEAIKKVFDDWIQAMEKDPNGALPILETKDIIWPGDTFLLR